MSNKELKQFLQKIIEECQKHPMTCDGCRFYSCEGCVLNGAPFKWNISRIGTAKWHKLYSWLVDLRFDLAPDAREGKRVYHQKKEKVELMNHIIEYMNQLEEEDDEA